MIHNRQTLTANPLPARRSGERQEDFVSRCMADETFQAEYPDQEQRLAVCYSQARRKRKGPKANETAEGWSMGVIPATIANTAARTEQWEGREYRVFPVVALKEGVHRGSDGSLFYPEEELEKFAEAWNGRPVPIFHPTAMDGRPVSSNQPAVIATQSVGYTFNFFYDRTLKALKGELWIDVGKAEQVHPGILAQMAQKMEVSTGLFSEMDAAPGAWNGEPYDAVARNYRPDHVALLPGGRGACSWGDGCGVRANAQDGGEGQPGGQVSGLSARLKDMAYSAMGILLALGKKPAGMSLEDVRSEVHKIVNSYDNPQWINFLRAVYDDSFVYLAEPINGNQPMSPGSPPRQARLYRQEYKWDAGKPVTTGDPTEVKEETRYVPVAANTVPAGADQSNQAKEDKPMANETKPCCEEKVQMLIEHEGTRFEEKDREWLLSLNAEQIDRLIPVEKPAAAPAPKPEATAAAVAVAATANAGKSVDQYIADAPPEMRGMLANAFREYQGKKATLVADLVANKNCRFTKEQLEGMETEALQNLTDLAKGAAVAPAPEVNGVFTGRAPAPTVMNADTKVEPLAVPTVNDFIVKKD
jgi:hypothetical protein